MHRRVRFGVFDLDLDEGVLMRSGTPVPIQPQPLRTLTALVSQPGRLVSRRELTAAIWPGNTHVDYQRGLNFCIRYLRALLEDDARSPRFIETVPRRGYRFIAMVSDHSSGPSGGSNVASRPGSEPGLIQRMSLLYLAAGLLIGAATLVLQRADAWRPSPPAGSIKSGAALDLYLTGRYQASKLNAVGLLGGIESFRAALDRDPELARAHAAIAMSYDQLAIRSTMRPGEAFRRAAAAAARALSFDHSLAEAHAALGLSAMYLDLDWARAGQSLRKALDLDPAQSQARVWLALLYAARGEHDRAIEEMLQARRVDPASRDVAQLTGWLYYFAGRYDDAGTECRRLIELEPRWASAYRCLEASQFMSGQSAHAVQTRLHFLDVTGQQEHARLVRQAYAVEGAAGVQRAALTAAARGLERGAPTLHVDLLVPMVRLGMTDAAIEEARRIVERREFWTPFLAVDPALEPLRGDPRFQRLLADMGLADVSPADVP